MMSPAILISLVVKTSIAWPALVALRRSVRRLGPAYQYCVGFCGMVSIASLALVVISDQGYRVEVSSPVARFFAFYFACSLPF